GQGSVSSSPAGISCASGTCSAKFDHGKVVTLTETPEAGSEFKGWSGACTGTGACQVTMSAAKSVTAEFSAVPKFKLTVSNPGNGLGPVASSPSGINCGNDCKEEYDKGKEVELTPSAEPGSEFKGWGGACTGTGACKVTMSAAKSVTATFELEQHQLSVTVGGTGQGSVSSSPAGISCASGTCSPKFDHGP